MEFENLKRIIDLINRKSPLQKKRLQRYLSEQDEQFWHLAEDFVRSYESFLQSEGLDTEYLVYAYLKMCQDMLKEQVKFLRTGCYSIRSAEQAYRDTYSNTVEMTSYMFGLGLSQFLWKNHYRIYRFLNRQIVRYADETASYLEIGAGHGLFLVEALRNMNCQHFEVVDISPVSIDISRKIIHFMSDKADRVNFMNMDMLHYDNQSAQFDFITMGEVIEHFEDPVPLLKKLKGLLSDQGRAFITTCSNCPAIDHVYLFNSVEEIRTMIRDCNFEIVEELVLPVESLPPAEMERHKVGHNYAAVIV